MGEAESFYVALVGALVGGCIGGLMSFLVQRWQYNINRRALVTDELCKEVIALADLSSEFWLKGRSVNNKQEMALMELRIKGGMARIDALKEPFEDWCPRGALVKVIQAHGDFADSVTGGQFTATKRVGDPDAAFNVQQAAADLTSAIRYALNDGFGIRAWFDRTFRKN